MLFVNEGARREIDFEKTYRMLRGIGTGFTWVVAFPCLSRLPRGDILTYLGRHNRDPQASYISVQ